MTFELYSHCRPSLPRQTKRDADEKDERDRDVATNVWEKLCQLNQEALYLSLN